MLSMCCGDGALEHGAPLGREHDVDAAAVVRAVLPRHEPRLGHAVDQAGDAAGGEGDVAC